MSRRRRDAGAVRIRLFGAGVGLIISGTFVLLLALAGWRGASATDANSVIPLLTIPITVLLGSQWATTIVRAKKFDARRVSFFTIEAVLIAQAIFVVLWAAAFSPAGLAGRPIDPAGAAVFLFALAFVFTAFPFFMLSWPFVALWAVVLRKLVAPREAMAVGSA